MEYKLDTSISLEGHIRRYLTAVRVEDPEHYRVPVFTLYTELNDALYKSALQSDGTKILFNTHHFKTWDIPVAFFNKTIGDLKKVGIIGTCKGGEEVFLSNAAWDLYVASTRQAVPNGH